MLEPIQTATTLDGQIDELATLLEARADLPATLIGYCWGAWLGLVAAARRPGIVRKPILVSSGPFEQKYVAALEAARMSRLSEEEGAELRATVAALGDPAAGDTTARLARLGALASKTDSYDPLPDALEESDRVDLRGDVFGNVWNDAAEMRRSGRLLELAGRIRCPVAAIHGDPHPAEGVRERFYEVLSKELC